MKLDPILMHIDDEALYNEFFAPLFRYLFFRTKDHNIANDLTQTSFLKFLSQEKKALEKEYAVKLLFTIARNTLIDYRRVETKRIHENVDDIENIRSEILNPEEDAILEEDKKFVREILHQLDDLEGEVFSMRLSGEIDYTTIAATLGISSVNARTIYSRALKKVGAELKKSNRF
jgi:RNA polymerase sigma-70 factor (ECF subfamily)